MGKDMFDTDCALCGRHITAESQEASGSKGIISTVTMINSHEFWYGLSGIFVFKKDLGLKRDDHICNDCIRVHKGEFEPSKTLPCSCCGELFQPTWEGSKCSGWDCSAEAFMKDGKLYIGAGWGSKYDTRVFEVIVPVVKEHDTVCDKCIAGFIEEESITANEDMSEFV